MDIPKIQLNTQPTYLKFGEGLDFFELFKKIEEQFETCFILESLGEQEDLSRYSIIGFDPKHIISGKEGKLIFDGEAFSVDNPYSTLREIVPQNLLSRNYAGGLVGFLGYDSINFFEPSLKVKAHPDFEAFKFGVFLDGVIFDKVTGEIYYFYYTDNRIDLLSKVSKKNLSKKSLKVAYLGDSSTKQEHTQSVKFVKEQILGGNTFQCEVGFKSQFEVEGDTIFIYENLRKVNPSPFMYYLKFGNQKIIGASPELLFRLRDGEMETYPLAGTTKRGKDEKEDKLLAKKLLSDPKEIAEHNMLVDLHRNDLGRVAQFGTVKVRNYLDIKRFSHVQHISSEIAALIRSGEDMFSSLASNFPAGTLTGAPKIESIKIIEKIEKEPRGPYGGAVGHFGFNGDCTFAIAIRSLFICGKRAFTQTSGGIVYDSIPEKEYEEVLNKLAAMKEVLS